MTDRKTVWEQLANRRHQFIGGLLIEDGDPLMGPVPFRVIGDLRFQRIEGWPQDMEFRVGSLNEDGTVDLKDNCCSVNVDYAALGNSVFSDSALRISISRGTHFQFDIIPVNEVWQAMKIIHNSVGPAFSLEAQVLYAKRTLALRKMNVRPQLREPVAAPPPKERTKAV